MYRRQHDKLILPRHLLSEGASFASKTTKLMNSPSSDKWSCVPMVLLSAVILALVVTATSCVPVKSHEEVIQEAIQKVVSSWIGSHKDKMIAQFGPPLRESKLSDGSTIMVWEEVKTRYRKGYAGIWADIPGQYYYVTCQMLFKADASGIIRDGSLKGC